MIIGRAVANKLVIRFQLTLISGYLLRSCQLRCLIVEIRTCRSAKGYPGECSGINSKSIQRPRQTGWAMPPPSVRGVARVSTAVSRTNDSLLIKLCLSSCLFSSIRDSIKFCLFFLRLLCPSPFCYIYLINIFTFNFP